MASQHPAVLIASSLSTQRGRSCNVWGPETRSQSRKPELEAFGGESMKILCATILLALLFAGSAVGQSGTSSLAGRVTDSSGLVISAATVTAVDEASGESRQMATNDLGDFVFAGLFPGTYTVKVQAQGF